MKAKKSRNRKIKKNLLGLVNCYTGINIKWQKAPSSRDRIAGIRNLSPRWPLGAHFDLFLHFPYPEDGSHFFPNIQHTPLTQLHRYNPPNTH